MRNSAMNWESVGLGIIAFATVLAVAIAAGIFAAKELEAGLPVLTTVLAMFLATISLIAYLLVVLFGLATIFRVIQSEKRAQIVNAATAVFAQAYTAVLAAGVVVYFPLLEKVLR